MQIIPDAQSEQKIITYKLSKLTQHETYKTMKPHKKAFIEVRVILPKSNSKTISFGKIENGNQI